MQFLIHKDLRTNSTIRWLLCSYLIALIAYLILMPVLEMDQVGITPLEIVRHVRGDASQFLAARSLVDVITDIHIKLFLHTIIGLILSAILLRTTWRDGLKTITVALLFLLPLLETLGLLGTSVVDPYFALLKCFGFWSLAGLQSILSASLLAFLLRPIR